MTYSSPSRTAVVLMPATSEPAPGSVMPRQPIGVAGDRGHEVALLLLLVAEQVDRRGDHVRVDGEAHVEAAAPRVAHRLGPHQRVEVVAALAAVLLRVAEAEEAEVAGPLQERVGPVVLLVLEAVGVDLLLHPRLHRLAQLLVLVGEDEVLARSAVVGLDDGLGSSGHCCLLGSVGRRVRAQARKWIVVLLTSRGLLSDRGVWGSRASDAEGRTTKAADSPISRLPPGPRSPGIYQTLNWFFRPIPFIERCRERYGRVFTIRLGPNRNVVVVAEPELAHELITGPADVYRAGDANGILRPVVGAGSLLVIDGDEHMRHRRILLPAFGAQHSQAFADEVRADRGGPGRDPGSRGRRSPSSPRWRRSRSRRS